MKRNILLYGLFLIAGLFLGWLIFSHSGNTSKDSVSVEQESSIWTCSMHPQIRQENPGKCPLCAMDLIPVKTGGAHGDNMDDPDAIQLSKEAMALANIQTTPVSRDNPVKQILLYGAIQADERLSRVQVSHVSGRIEKLFVNSTGETVKKGQVIASLYSPDLQNAQQELLEAVKLQALQPALLNAAREKLRQWKLSDEQISVIEQSGKVMPVINLVADFSGSVITKKVEQGDYVTTGSPLFDLSDLSNVWALFNAYESDLPYLKTGDKVSFNLQALPGKSFSGTVTFIDPVMDKTNRTAKIRVETSNPGMLMKPGMYAEAAIRASLKQQENAIVIPKSSVLWTGKRSIVYVKQPNIETPVFKMREIELGASLGDSFVVLSGIEEGEEIVTNGVFAIDASAQLEGKTSMMNQNNPAVAGEQATMTVPGLCGMCKERIEKTAKSITGIFSAVWDINTKLLNLHYDPDKTSPDEVAKALAKVGHDTGKYKADDAVYQALPECCKYRE